MTLQESGNARLRELNSADDLADLVHAVGFIPLFSNAVKGFSVEELTRGSAWWTGDPDTDPWEWRKMLAVDPDIAYGKFFGRNAGFVDKDFFPVFANYRRNGYDYDALYEDGLASHRSKKIMDVFGLDEEACGSELMTPTGKRIMRVPLRIFRCRHISSQATSAEGLTGSGRSTDGI